MSNNSLYRKILEHDFVGFGELVIDETYQEIGLGWDFHDQLMEAIEELNLNYLLEIYHLESSVFNLRKQKMTAKLWKKDE